MTKKSYYKSPTLKILNWLDNDTGESSYSLNNNNFKIINNILYSYGEHWPLCYRYKTHSHLDKQGKVVRRYGLIVNNGTYSGQTSLTKRWLYHAINKSKKNYTTIHYVNDRNDLGKAYESQNCDLMFAAVMPLHHKIKNLINDNALHGVNHNVLYRMTKAQKKTYDIAYQIAVHSSLPHKSQEYRIGFNKNIIIHLRRFLSVLVDKLYRLYMLGLLDKTTPNQKVKQAKQLFFNNIDAVLDQYVGPITQVNYHQDLRDLIKYDDKSKYKIMNNTYQNLAYKVWLDRAKLTGDETTLLYHYMSKRQLTNEYFEKLYVISVLKNDQVVNFSY